MSKVICSFCNKVEADDQLRLDKKRVCRVCAHNASHLNYMMPCDGYLPIPVVDDKHNVIRFGIYPNIDWS